MSWYLPVGVVRPPTITAVEQAVEAALAAARGPSHGTGHVSQFDAEETRAEVAEQLQAATSAAGQLLSGFGLAEAVTIDLSGHANPGHEPREGWAPESVTATVTAVEAPKDTT